MHTKPTPKLQFNVRPCSPPLIFRRFYGPALHLPIGCLLSHEGWKQKGTRRHHACQMPANFFDLLNPLIAQPNTLKTGGFQTTFFKSTNFDLIICIGKAVFLEFRLKFLVRNTMLVKVASSIFQRTVLELDPLFMYSYVSNRRAYPLTY